MRSVEEMLMQAKVLQAQLREMKRKHVDYAPEFWEGIGKLRAIAWAIGGDGADKSLALTNEQLARIDLIHGAIG